jgi:hypothetical protein
MGSGQHNCFCKTMIRLKFSLPSYDTDSLGSGWHTFIEIQKSMIRSAKYC